MINYVELDAVDVQKGVYSGYLEKLKSKLFGLLREREKQREWEKFLDTILIELYGFPTLAKTINYYILYYKLSSLKYLDYSYFRKTIFECMNLVDNLDKSGDLDELL